MPEFSYRLVCLTHGDSSTLEPVLRAFGQHATPAPAETRIVVDGTITDAHRELAARMSFSLTDSDLDLGPFEFIASEGGLQEGFCKATARAWAEGAKPGVSHVVHLEHDFLVTRRVDWREVAAVLDRYPDLAQMALMRQAVNETEKAAGGLYESRRDQYTPWNDELHPGALRGATEPVTWLSHTAYATTNISMMRREFMAENEWPTNYDRECEGRYGIDLVAAGFRFGVWGSGEPWSEHVGVRDGSGHSY